MICPVFWPALVLAGLVNVFVRSLEWLAQRIGKKVIFVTLLIISFAGIMAYPPVIHLRTDRGPLSGERTRQGSDIFAPLARIMNSPYETYQEDWEHTESYSFNVPVLLLEILFLAAWLWSIYFMRHERMTLYWSTAGGLVGIFVMIWIEVPTWLGGAFFPLSIIMLSLLSGTVWRTAVTAWKTLTARQKWYSGLSQIFMLMTLSFLLFIWWLMRAFEGFPHD
jgi:hypothetical protein